ncbi:substrate-binding periplasmic protein [Colwellia echini]|uniref:ABC transporter substrate-binding protein n=1 Tax=Colwellia echini TaxID=1982103 RepID=A0ABY3N0N1_9GAMM|nr:ABC transporter substrate-binding protein [Colwellia echini]TYK67056.1 ABC transporter substrate-binding protein [Colwellia echini]
MKIKLFFVVFLFLQLGISSSVNAENSISAKKSVNEEKTLKIAFGDALAPWVSPASNNGIIVDIFTQALNPSGYTIENIYLPYARRVNAYKSGEADVSSDMNIRTIQHEKLEGYLSHDAYTYQNYAFALEKNNFNFHHLDELANHSLVSWQGAIAHLGGEYAVMASKNPLYLELHDQAAQVKMLFAERVDVIQLDLQIFKYYRAYVAKNNKVDTTEVVEKFPLFGKSPNGYLFKDSVIRDEFNRRLIEMKENGEYEAIFERYTNKPEFEINKMLQQP